MRLETRGAWRFFLIVGFYEFLVLEMMVESFIFLIIFFLVMEVIYVYYFKSFENIEKYEKEK